MAKECTPKMFYRLVKERALNGDNIDQFCQYMIDEKYDLPTSSADKPLVYWRGQYNALRKVALNGEKTARASGNVKAIDNAVLACRLTKLVDKPKGKSGSTGGKLAVYADIFGDDMDDIAEEQARIAAESLASETKLNPADTSKLQELVTA